jgi:hypothetical protein
MGGLERRIDPEPISIYMALMATLAASVASMNYIKSHRKPLPSRTRRAVYDDVTQVEDHVRKIRTDLETIKQVFSRADYISGNTMQLGNGVYLPTAEFNRYERTAASVFRTLSALHRTSLKLERHAMSHDGLEMGPATNQLGEAYDLFESLRTTMNLTVERAWRDLDRLASLIEEACNSVREQLRG